MSSVESPQTAFAPGDIPRKRLDACYLCGFGDYRIVIRDEDLRFGYPGLYTVAECKGCGFHFTLDPPATDVLASWYREGYGSKDYEGGGDNSGVERNMLNVFRRFLKRMYVGRLLKQSSFYWKYLIRDRIDRFLPQEGRILDFGCGEGFLMSYLKKYKREIVGLEPSRKSADVARRLGFSVIEGGSDNFNLEGQRFDAVFLSQVIEHLEDPRGVLRAISGALCPGGSLILSCPNIDSWVRRVFGRAWVNWHLPFHLWYFSPNTLQILLESEGWRVKKVVTATPPIWFVWSFLLWGSAGKGAKHGAESGAGSLSVSRPAGAGGDCIFIEAVRSP